jgi:ankyrin repeat protein
MKGTTIGLVAAMATFVITSCASAPRVEPTAENNFLGMSVEDRVNSYSGQGPNDDDEAVIPPLILAVDAHDAEAIAALVAKGANVNVGKDDTPLVSAIDVEPQDLNINVVKALLAQRGIEVNKYSAKPMGDGSWSRTAIVAAAYHGYLEVCKLLVEKGAKVDLPDHHLPDVQGFDPKPLNTALIYAAEGGYPEVVTYLLDKGAKIDYQNSDAETALMMACAQGSMGNPKMADKEANIAKAIAILLDRGAKYDMLAIPAKPKYQKIELPPGTPAAVSNMVLLNGAGMAALHNAANTGFLAAAKLLLDKGANIEIASYQNKGTPLIVSINPKNHEMISFLLDRGANIEATTAEGTTTPLMLTAAGLYYDTAALLLKRGANVNHGGTYNALEYATNVGRADKEGLSIQMMNLFLDAGINIEFQSGDGSTALMEASGWGVIPSSPTRAKLLLDKGAKVDVQNKKGETALMQAAYRGYYDIAKLLVDHGAGVDLKNSDGRTALMIASSAIIDLNGTNHDFDRIVSLLLDKGANVNVLDKKKSNALSLATQYERAQTIALLKAKGATLNGTAKPVDPPIVGTWEGTQNGNPYEWFRYTFKSDKTFSYTAGATAAFKKQYPDSYEGMNEQYKNQAALSGSSGTYSFREQFLVLKTVSIFSPQVVFQVLLDGDKLNLNGGQLILTRVGK